MPKKKGLTNAELALLSLLAEKPMHAYEIGQIIDDRGMRDWTQIGFSSIYYLLNKMHNAGWLNRTQADSEIGGPAKHIFSLSKSGRKKWEVSAINSITFPHRGDNPFLIGLSVIPLLEVEKVSVALDTHLITLQKEIVRLEQKIDGFGNNVPTHVKAMFDYTLGQIRASIDWIEIWQHKLGK